MMTGDLRQDTETPQVPRGWRGWKNHQVLRRDMPLHELLVTIILIVVVWVADVFVVRPAYDRDYFTVQRSVRAQKANCRDMVVDYQAPGLYMVSTCGRKRLYRVHGKKVVLLSDVPDEVGTCPKKH